MEIVINKVIMTELEKAYNRYNLEGVFPTSRGTVTLSRPDTGEDNINDPWYDPRTGVQWSQVPESPYWEPTTDWYNKEDKTPYQS